MNKIQRFLAKREELIADFLMDMENAEGSNKAYEQAVAVWLMQSARVKEIQNVIESLVNLEKPSNLLKTYTR